MSSYEERVIEFESARNEAADSYFGERPQIDRTIERERIFESGFRMAWELCQKYYGGKSENTELLRFIEAKMHHLPIEDQHVASALIETSPDPVHEEESCKRCNHEN